MLLASATASATTIDPLTWNQLLMNAELVGIVECKVAGEIVARYTVIESWKGPRVGAELSIEMATNFWGQQAPIALVGERSLVTAFKSSPTQYQSTSSGGPVPIWWRQVDAQLRLPLFQGELQLPRDPAAPLPRSSYRNDAKGVFETDALTLSDYRAKAQTFLALRPEAQEASVLVTLTHKYFSEYADEGPARERALTLVKELAKLEAPAAVVDRLLQTSAQADGGAEAAYLVERVLGQGGRSTIEHLQALTSPPPLVAAVLERIRPQQGTAPHDEEKTSPPPSRVELARLRTALKTGKDETGEAFETLTTADCRSVVDYLVDWKAVDPRVGGGYGLGSYLGWRCGTDRRANLLRLTTAKDPFIRVAGAVYLTFQDEKAGLKKLKQLAALPGDPGAWAAITLARRGDKASIPRALEVFDAAADGTIAGEVREQLQGRLCVLLSNTRSTPAPPLPNHCEWKPEARAALEKWWAARGPELTLGDPWLAGLEAQHVD